MERKKRFLSRAEQLAAIADCEKLVPKMVRRICRSIRPGTPDYEDAEQQARIGLLIAAKTFDRRTGVSFHAHAYLRITVELKRFLRAHRRHGFKCVGPQELDTVSILDFVVDEDTALEEGLAVSDKDTEVHCEAMAALEVLDERERQILAARLLEGRSLSSVSAGLNITGERVRQIQASAIKSLRRKLPGLVALANTNLPGANNENAASICN